MTVIVDQIVGGEVENLTDHPVAAGCADLDDRRVRWLAPSAVSP